MNRLTFAGSLLLVGIAFAMGFAYLLNHRWPSNSSKPPPLQAQMLRVTAITTDDRPRAVVNGQRVGVGDLLTVPTATGSVSVKVEKIEDGLVRFACGREIVDAKLAQAPEQSP